MRLPKSALKVLEFLSTRGPLPPREISRGSKVPLRTVTFALDRLVLTEICKKVPNLNDMRRTLYTVNHEKARAIFSLYGMRMA
jgi:DNA-binding MarR family transcriptional regulator